MAGGEGRLAGGQGKSASRSDEPEGVSLADRVLYEELYCERGEMENRIKEPLSLVAGRVSAETMRASQLRLHLAACASVQGKALRRLGRKGTEMEHAQATTLRLRLRKIGARIRTTARRVRMSMVKGFAPVGAAGVNAVALLRRVRRAEHAGNGYAILRDRRRNLGRKFFRSAIRGQSVSLRRGDNPFRGRPEKWPLKITPETSLPCSQRALKITQKSWLNGASDRRLQSADLAGSCGKLQQAGCKTRAGLCK